MVSCSPSNGAQLPINGIDRHKQITHMMKRVWFHWFLIFLCFASFSLSLSDSLFSYYRNKWSQTWNNAEKIQFEHRVKVTDFTSQKQRAAAAAAATVATRSDKPNNVIADQAFTVW